MATQKKYKLLKNDTIRTLDGKVLFRIEALISFSALAKGDKGGYIEKEGNLNQYGNAWVSGDARVSGDAQVYGNARVYGNAQVYGDARVSGRISLTVNCDVDMPRILIDTKDKLAKLLKVMNELKEV